MPKPNFFIIGGMKCGTTSLHNYLSQHPQMFMSEPKEPAYFVKELGMDMGINAYMSLFEDAGDAKIIGESTTSYTKLPVYQGVAESIHSFNPDAKLLYVIREPVSRTISHYWYNALSLRWPAENRPIMKAIKDDVQYIEFSNYKRQLIPYVDLFGRENIYVISYEKLFKNLFTEVNAICAWLDVDKFENEELFKQKWNVTPEVLSQASGFGMLNSLRNSRLWGSLAHLFPKKIRTTFSDLSVKKINKKEETTDEVRDYLSSVFIQQRAELEDYLEMTFPEWDK